MGVLEAQADVLHPIEIEVGREESESIEIQFGVGTMIAIYPERGKCWHLQSPREPRCSYMNASIAFFNSNVVVVRVVLL